MYKRREKAIDKQRVRKEAERFFQRYQEEKQRQEPPMFKHEETKYVVPLDDELRKAVTNIPDPPKRKKKKAPEGQVLRDCLKLLKDLSIFAWRNNSGSMQVGGRYIKFGKAGSSDIIGMLPCGRFLGIECKSKTGRQSKNQIMFQKQVEANGGLYLLVRSAAELAEHLGD